MFSQPVTIVLELLTQALTSLDPGLPVVFTKLVGERESPLEALIELKQVSLLSIVQVLSAVQSVASSLC